MTEVHQAKGVEPAPNTKPTCPKCGSDNVVRDAWASWDPASALWELKTTFDQLVCGACGEGMTEPVWVELDPAPVIREHNDRFRGGDDGVPGRVVITSGIRALVDGAGDDVLSIITAVKQFDTFTEDNDPHLEHDFGQFDFAGQSCFWKIDLFDPSYQWGTETPTDLTQTRRVLTIMLASEY